MAVLEKKQIVRRIFDEKDVSSRIWINPLLEDDQIGEGSVDLRLGTEFVIFRQSNLRYIDPSEGKNIIGEIGKYQERIKVQYGEEVILHPGQFVLGCTLEYIGLPYDITSQVEGRSSWGRLGLIIATATPVAPGFRGVITLELINAGQVPIILYPGVRIGQMVFSLLCQKVEIGYKGRYKYPTGPEFSKIYKDEDIKYWAKDLKKIILTDRSKHNVE